MSFLHIGRVDHQDTLDKSAGYLRTTKNEQGIERIGNCTLGFLNLLLHTSERVVGCYYHWISLSFKGNEFSILD